MMNRYFLDTNIFIYLVDYKLNQKQQSSPSIVPPASIAQLENLINQPDVEIYVSIIVFAELLVLTHTRKWGKRRLFILDSIISKMNFVDIDNMLWYEYGIIELYNKALPVTYLYKTFHYTGTHRDMGKNDIWIAATALRHNFQLITADGDFDHLNGLLNVIRIKP